MEPCTVSDVRLVRAGRETSEWFVTDTGDAADIDHVTGIEYEDAAEYICCGRCAGLQTFACWKNVRQHLADQARAAEEVQR